MQFATTLGWTLVHFVWQGFAVLLLYLLIMLALRNRRPETRYLFSVVSLLVLSLLPFATFFYLASNSAAIATTGLQNLATLAINATPDSLQFNLSTILEPALPYAVMAWMAGVIVMMIRFSIGLSEVNRLRNTAQWDIPITWQTSLDSLVERMQIPREVGLAISTLVQSPLVIGWLKPLILVPPSALTGLSALQLEMILAHELEHIRRWDYLVNLWQVAVESFLFYHPAVRIVSRRIRVDRESCCDDAAVRLCGNPITYARALAQLEDLRQGNMLAVNFQMGIAHGRLLDRIQRLVGRTRHVQQGSLWFTGAFMVGILTMSAVATHYSFQTFKGKNAEPGVMTTNTSTLAFETVPASELTLERVLPSLPAAAAPVENTAQPGIAVDSNESMNTDPKQDLVSQPEETNSKTKIAESVRVEQTGPANVQIEMVEATVAGASKPAEAVVANTDPQVPATQTEQLLVPEHTPVLSGGELLHAVSPEFPRQAKRKRISGHVKIAFTVDENGRVRDPQVIEAEPKTYFEDAAMDAIAQWRFKPFREDGVPKSKRVMQQLDFNLDVYLARNSSRNCYRMTGSRICRPLQDTIQKDQRVAIIKLD